MAGELAALSYLKAPQAVVEPAVKRLLPQEEGYDVKVCRSIYMDADGDGLDNDVFGMGYILRSSGSVFSRRNEVQRFLFLIRAQGMDQGLATTILSSGGKVFDPDHFTPSYGYDESYDGPPTRRAAVVVPSCSHYGVTLSAGHFVKDSQQIWVRLNALARPAKNQNIQEKETQILLNAKDLSVVDSKTTYRKAE